MASLPAILPPTSGTAVQPALGSCVRLYGHGIANVAPGAVAALEIRLRESTAASGLGNPNGNERHFQSVLERRNVPYQDPQARARQGARRSWGVEGSRSSK